MTGGGDNPLQPPPHLKNQAEATPPCTSAACPACHGKAARSASPPSAPSFGTARHGHRAPVPGPGSSSPKVIYASLGRWDSHTVGFCESKKLLPPDMTMSSATCTGDIRSGPTTWDRLTDLLQPQCHQLSSADIHNKCELFQ